jgi:hypothetical protein
MVAFSGLSKRSTLVPVVALAALAAAWSPFARTRLRQQPTPVPSPVDTIPAPLLRRLAEAADAYRDNKAHWFIVHTDYPYDITSVLDTVPGGPLPPGLGAFGPYRTPFDYDLEFQPFVICQHLQAGNPSAYAPGKTRVRPAPETVRGQSHICPGRPRRLADILHLTLQVFSRTDTTTFDIDPREVDALFFSVSAVDKFGGSYYSRYGAQYVSDLGDSLEAFVRSTP